MSRKPLVLAALLPLSLALAAASSPATKPAAPGLFKPTEAQAASARMVYGLLSDSRYAYRPRNLDDRLSADIFRRYIESLDGQKLFFTQADLTRFNPYRTTLDDSIKSQNLTAPYDVFATYVKRVDQRVAYARSLLAKPMDFSAKEDFAYEREDAPWAANEAELNEVWRKYVKNDVLRLRLAGRPADEIRKTLDKRYAQLAGRVHELRGDDVFESFMATTATAAIPHTGRLTSMVNWPPVPLLIMAPNTVARPMPTSPPNRHSAPASASTKPSTLASEKPSVLSTASSGTRSRTLCAIVLPTTSSRVKNTANRIQRTIMPMSPICLRKPTLKSFSVCVLVSSGEFSNLASIVSATDWARSGSLSRIV